MTFQKAMAAAALALFASTASARAEVTSMAALIASGQSLECTYQHSDDSGAQSGTLYLAGEKMRGDLQMTLPDGTYPMSMLREGGWQYMWGDAFGPGQGMKVQAAAAASGQGPQGRQGPDINEAMDFQCTPWTADASKFVLPGDVQFMELGQIVPGGVDMRALQCGACDQIPEDGRAECLQMMGC